jgi:regulatory protein
LSAGQDEALVTAYAYVDRRERTVAEVRRKLAGAGIEPAAIEDTLDELLALGVLDDARYARLFTQDKRELEGWGSDRIARTLLERGIDRDVARAAVKDGAGPSELQRALALLEQRFPGPPVDNRERERALGVLLRKGYESEVALDALARWRAGPD